MSHENQWDEKVARGRALVTEINDRKWELGDLANEVCPATGNGVRNDDTLGKFADEIGLTRESLKKYRYVAARWAAGTRVPAQTWTTHRMLAERDDRFDVIAEQTWTYNSLSDRLGRLPNPSRQREPQVADHEAMVEAIRANPETAKAAAAALNYAEPQVKREAFQRLSGDREVTEDASTRMVASTNLEKASADSRFAGKAAQKKEQREAEAKSRHTLRFLDADMHLGSAVAHLRDAIKEMESVAFSDEERDLLAVRMTSLTRLATVVENIVAGASVDWDAELANLGGQA